MGTGRASAERGGRRRGRRAARTLLGVALATVLLAAPAGGAGTPPATGPSAETPVGPGAPATQPPAAPSRYRIVGCRSSGSAAYRNGPPRREVAVGFDDGPAADTSEFVSMLEREHTQATFFMIGRQLTPAYRPLLLRELRDGDVLGDHSFTHPDLAISGEVFSQLQRTLRAIRSISGYTPCLFRPPYGDYDRTVVADARALGMATVTWDVDPRDWALPGTGAIVQTVLSEVGPGSIILSHDGGGPRGQTLAAYPAIIAALRARGYRIVTIPQLLGFRPVYRPCVALCAGIGVTRAALPRDAIVERAR
jgi:peptidoglycan/xylan/chitin deacetylase (PgdA/CDA1 family)